MTCFHSKFCRSGKLASGKQAWVYVDAALRRPLRELHRARL